MMTKLFEWALERPWAFTILWWLFTCPRGFILQVGIAWYSGFRFCWAYPYGNPVYRKTRKAFRKMIRAQIRKHGEVSL